MRLSAAVVLLMIALCRSAMAQDVEVEDAEPTAQEAEVATDEDVQPEESEAARAERLEEARLLFLAAERAFDNGRYPDALASFERSYLLAEDPQILYNIGVTLDRLRRDDEALEAFQMYLRLRPETPDRRSIEARVQILEDQIAQREAEADAPPEERPAEIDVTTTEADVDQVDEDGEYTVLDRWWFWTALVLIAGAGATAIALVLSQDPSPEPGADGVVLEALSW